MDKSHAQLLALGTLGALFSIGLVTVFKSNRKAAKRLKDLKENNPLDVNSFKKISHQLKKGDSVVLRIVPNLQKPENQQKDFRSNHQFFCVPDEREYVKQKIAKQQQKYDNKRWRGHDVHQFLNSVELKGLGQVLDGVLEVDVQATKTISWKQLSFFKKLYYLFSGVLEYILGSLSILFIGKYRSFLFLKGVKIGTFDVKYDWFKGHMLVECELGTNADLAVKTLSLSYDRLIAQVQRDVTRSYQFYLFIGSMWLATIYSIFQIIKENTRRKKAKQFTKKMAKYKQLVFQTEEQGNTCVICMENNRNLLFDSCGHLLSCVRCASHFTNNRCPLCKQEIHAQKIFAISNDR